MHTYDEKLRADALHKSGGGKYPILKALVDPGQLYYLPGYMVTLNGWLSGGISFAKEKLVSASWSLSTSDPEACLVSSTGWHCGLKLPSAAYIAEEELKGGWEASYEITLTLTLASNPLVFSTGKLIIEWNPNLWLFVARPGATVSVSDSKELGKERL